MKRIRPFWTLALLTLVEAVRQPIFLLLTTTCVMLTVLAPMILMYKFGEDGKLARDTGFALHFLCGLFVAGHAAATSLTKEIQTGTAAAVLSKPVSRECLFLAKYAGIAAVVALFSVCSATATLIGERVAERYQVSEGFVGYVTDWPTAFTTLLVPPIAFLIAAILNYTRRRAFPSAAFWALLAALATAFLVRSNFDRLGAFDPFSFLFDWRLVSVSLLIGIALLVLAALALALSARLEPVSTITLCSAVFLLGLVSDHLFAHHAQHSALAATAWRLLPNWQPFWMSDALNAGGHVSWVYVGHVAVYATGTIAGLLCLGLASFRHAEIS